MAAKKPDAKASSEDNLALWSKLEETDPLYTKAFNLGRFKGTDINATYRMRHLTELFGPAGKGFGFDIGTPIFYGTGDFQAVTISAALWWMEGDVRHTAPAHYGGTKLFTGGKNTGPTGIDEDAVKKAVTDAMGKAALAMGAHADVYMGLHDDSKYVDGLNDKFAAQEEPHEEPKVDHNIAEGDMDGDVGDDVEPPVNWPDWFKHVRKTLLDVETPADFRKWQRQEKAHFAQVKTEHKKVYTKAMALLITARYTVGLMSVEEHDQAIADLEGK
jgi:hypothetical protein